LSQAATSVKIVNRHYKTKKRSIYKVFNYLTKYRFKSFGCPFSTR